MVASDIIYVKPFNCVIWKQLLQYLLKCALHLSSWRLKCYYNQANSVGTDRENVVPRNLIIIWKHNEVWPLKNSSYGHFLAALKAFKTQRELHHCLAALQFFNTKKGHRWFIMTLKVFNPEKRRHHCLKGFNTEKGLPHLLRTLKVLNIEKVLHHFLETLKGFNFWKITPSHSYNSQSLSK